MVADAPPSSDVSEAQLDVIGADIGTVGSAIRVTLRLADLGTGEVPPGGYARLYSVVLTVGDERVVLVARESEDGTQVSGHVEDAANGAIGAGAPPPQPATASVNRRSDTVAVLAPFSSLRVFLPFGIGAEIARGTVVTARDVTPRYPLTTAPIVSARPDVDEATTMKATYRVGDRSCRQ